MENRKDSRGTIQAGGTLQCGNHSLHSGHSDLICVGIPEMGKPGDPQAKAGTRGADQNITVYGRGALNWEVLVDGHCVARFDAKSEAFEWAELLRGKEDSNE